MKRWVKRDVLIVAAAGNDKRNDPWFPAGFTQDPRFAAHVVAVGALERGRRSDGYDWRPAEFSNYGDWVTAWAPGVDIVSEYPDDLNFEYRDANNQPIASATFSDGRAKWDGTSFAAPYVAARIVRHAIRRNTTPLRAWQLLKRNRPYVTFLPGDDEQISKKRVSQRGKTAL